MSWLSRLVNVIRRDRVDHDLEEEMRFHLAARTDDLDTRRHAGGRRTGTGPPAIRQHAAPAGVEPRHQAAAAARIDSARRRLRPATVSAQQDRNRRGRRLSFTGHRRLHGRFLADRCADPAAVAGQRSPVADLHRVARTRGYSGRPQLQLSPLRPTARCEPGAGTAVRA